MPARARRGPGRRPPIRPIHPPQTGMTIEASEFRKVLGHWLTGVAVVTARATDGRPRGLTANAITSLSLDPPLVLVCVDRKHLKPCPIPEAFIAQLAPYTMPRDEVRRQLGISAGGK